jgi:hypothetical protein
MGIDEVFTRCLLSDIRAEARKRFRSIKRITDCESAVRSGRQTWFVEIVVPGEDRLHLDCRAYNSAEAKYKGWCALLRRSGYADARSD